MQKNKLETNAFAVGETGRVELRDAELIALEKHLQTSGGVGGYDFESIPNWFCGLDTTNSTKCGETLNKSCKNEWDCQGSTNMFSCFNEIDCRRTDRTNEGSCTNTFSGSSGMCPPSRP